MLERLCDRHGYVLKDKTTSPQGPEGFIADLRAREFTPATVIDVGVGYGTPWLYDGFPDARIELFEPLDIFVPAMQNICNTYRARYHLTALAGEAGEVEMDVNLQTPTDSTMAGFSAALSPLAQAGRDVTIQNQRVPVQRLDAFGPFEEPILLKLDVEGSEIDVLRGATATLARTEIAIAEISVAQRHERDASFGTVVHYLEDHDFRLMDILSLTPMRRGGPLYFIDAAFTRSTSLLRR